MQKQTQSLVSEGLFKAMDYLEFHQPPICPWDSPRGRILEKDYDTLLQIYLLTTRSNPHLLHWVDSYPTPLSHTGRF